MSSIRVHIARTRNRFLIGYYSLYDTLIGSDKAIRHRLEKNGYHRSDYTFREDELMFVHLPKTGGTSIARLLAKDPKERFAHLDIHKPVSVNCPPENFRYITVMRDPVQRVWSQYQMLLRSPDGYPYKKYATKGLETLLKKFWGVRNMNCRYLTGQIDHEPDQQTLALAQSQLASFYQVIDFEHFESEVSALLAQLDIPSSIIPNERKSQYKAPDEKDIALIESYNQLDIALHNHWKGSKTREEVTT